MKRTIRSCTTNPSILSRHFHLALPSLFTDTPQQPPSSLVPVNPLPPPSIFSQVSAIVAHAIHSTVMLVANLKRVRINEHYVKKVLREQVGMDPIDVDIVSMTHPSVVQASVRLNIEPVVACLRSHGVTGTALAQFLARYPSILLQDVDERVLPMCQFLIESVGRHRGMGVLLKYPEIAEVHPLKLKETAHILRDEVDSDDVVPMILLTMPSVFCDIAKYKILLEKKNDLVEEKERRQSVESLASVLKNFMESSKRVADGSSFKELEGELKKIMMIDRKNDVIDP